MYSIQSDCRGSDPCILPFWTEALESPVISDCSFSAAAVLREFRFVAFEKAKERTAGGVTSRAYCIGHCCQQCVTVPCDCLREAAYAPEEK